jgi:AraC-like DNA-binding protein
MVVENTNMIKIEYVKRNNGPFNMASKHYHNRYEIYYLLSGERNYFIRDKIYYIKKGDIVLIAKNELHKTTDTDISKHERILIEFSDNYIKELLLTIKDINPLGCFNQGNHVIRLNPEKQIWIENLFNQLLKEYNDDKPGSNTYTKLLLLELLIFLNRNYVQLQKNLESQDDTHQKVSQIAQYINKNYYQSITLEKLANRFAISPYYLSRLFKKVTGFSITEYKNSIRIKEAQRLLIKSRDNITTISGKVGYSNTTHFGRVFKNITGMSPTDYRKVYNN